METYVSKYTGKQIDEAVDLISTGLPKPDLSQNDPTAPDYVKSRTHYEEFATIIEEREVRAWFDGTGVAVSRIPQVGEKLTVTLNGNTYKCTAWETEGNIGLGNGEAVGVIDRGENVPFFAGFLVDGESGPGAFIATAMEGENTISIVDASGNTLLEEAFSVEVNVDEPVRYSADFPLDQPLIVGNTYKVVYDGVSYECVAWEDDDVCLGNGELDGYRHSEDVPFMISTYHPNDGLVWYLAFYGSDSHTISISGMVVHKLDHKYFPDGYPCTTIGNGDLVDEYIEVSSGDEIEVSFSRHRPIAGETYTIQLDSVEYTCEARREGGAVILADDNLPFTIKFYEFDNSIRLAAHANYSGGLYVYGTCNVVQPLADKYLPTRITHQLRDFDSALERLSEYHSWRHADTFRVGTTGTIEVTIPRFTEIRIMGGVRSTSQSEQRVYIHLNTYGSVDSSPIILPNNWYPIYFHISMESNTMLRTEYLPTYMRGAGNSINGKAYGGDMQNVGGSFVQENNTLTIELGQYLSVNTSLSIDYR